MSGLAGFVTKHLREDAEELVRAAVLAMAQPAVHLVRSIHTGNIGIGLGVCAYLDDCNTHHCEKHGVVVACDGELYNNRDLQRELRSLGYAFSSNGDAELIASAFDNWGTDCFHRLNGNFAIVIVASTVGRVILARDHAGARSLAYCRHEESVYFASEAKAIFSMLGQVPHANSRQILRDALFGFWGTSVETYFDGIMNVEAGSFVSISEEGVTSYRFWEPNAEPNVGAEGDFREIVEELSSLLEDAVSIRLIQGERIGASLSGGLDSSLVATIAAKRLRALDCFTLRYEDAVDRDYQLAYALVQRTNSMRFHPVSISRTHLTIQRVDEVTRCMEGVLWDKAYVSIYMMYALASVSGVRVMLNGQGSDEAWLGYYNHYPMVQRLASATEYRAFRDEELSTNPLYRFMDSTVASEVFDEHCEHIWESFGHASGIGRLHSLVKFGIRSHLRNMLMQEEKLSRAHGVISRAPFADHRLLTLATRIAPSLKLFDGREKFILRLLGARMLPKEIVERAKAPLPDMPASFGAIADTLLSKTLLQDLSLSPLVKEILPGIDNDSIQLIEPSERWKIFALMRFEKTLLRNEGMS